MWGEAQESADFSSRVTQKGAEIDCREAYGVRAHLGYAPASTVQIHTALDTPEAVDPRQLLRDAETVARFVCFAANDEDFCKHVAISEKIRGEVETYFHGKI